MHKPDLNVCHSYLLWYNIPQIQKLHELDGISDLILMYFLNCHFICSCKHIQETCSYSLPNTPILFWWGHIQLKYKGYKTNSLNCIEETKLGRNLISSSSEKQTTF